MLLLMRLPWILMSYTVGIRYSTVRRLAYRTALLLMSYSKYPETHLLLMSYPTLCSSCACETGHDSCELRAPHMTDRELDTYTTNDTSSHGATRACVSSHLAPPLGARTSAPKPKRERERIPKF